MTDEQILAVAREVGWNTEHKASNDYLIKFARALMAGKAEPERKPTHIPESWATHGGLWIEALYRNKENT